jgi:hypothetical protein
MLGLLRLLPLTVLVRGWGSMSSPLMHLESGRRCCRTLEPGHGRRGMVERLKKSCPDVDEQFRELVDLTRK